MSNPDPKLDISLDELIRQSKAKARGGRGPGGKGVRVKPRGGGAGTPGVKKAGGGSAKGTPATAPKQQGQQGQRSAPRANLGVQQGAIKKSGGVNNNRPRGGPLGGVRCVAELGRDLPSGSSAPAPRFLGSSERRPPRRNEATRIGDCFQRRSRGLARRPGRGGPS